MLEKAQDEAYTPGSLLLHPSRVSELVQHIVDSERFQMPFNGYKENPYTDKLVLARSQLTTGAEASVLIEPILREVLPIEGLDFEVVRQLARTSRIFYLRPKIYPWDKFERQRVADEEIKPMRQVIYRPLDRGSRILHRELTQKVYDVYVYPGEWDQVKR